jgi:hypothetical protein
MQSAEQVLESLSGLRAVKLVRELLAKQSASGYLVGGALRDLFLGAKPRTYSFVTDNPLELARSLTGLVGGSARERELGLGPVARYYGELGEIFFLRADGLGPAEFLERNSGFTIDALAFDLESCRIFESHGAGVDMRNRVIRLAPAAASTAPAPPALLRAVTLSLTLHDFTLESQTRDAIKAHRHLIAQAAPSAVEYELSKILNDGDYLRGLNLLDELGLLRGMLRQFLPCALSQDRPGGQGEPDAYPLDFLNRLGRAMNELLSDAPEFLRKHIYLLRVAALLTPRIREELTRKTPPEVKPFLIWRGEQIERELYGLTTQAVNVFRVRMIGVGYLAGVAPLLNRRAEVGELEGAVEQTIETFGAWKGLLSSVLICADWAASHSGDGAREGDLRAAREVLLAKAKLLTRAAGPVQFQNADSPASGEQFRPPAG